MTSVGELIEKLSKYPKDLPAFIFDVRRNIGTDYGEGSSEGIHEITAVDRFEYEATGEERHWVSLEFVNPDFDADGKRVEEE